MAFIKARVAVRPLTHILLSSLLAGIVTSTIWLLVTWAVEGMPGKTVIEGKTVQQPLSKQLLERALIGFFSGFVMALIMSMFTPEPVPQARSVKEDLKEAAYRNEHPCAAQQAPVPCAYKTE